MNSNNSLDKVYLEMALVWSKRSHCNRKKVGVIVVKDNTIISDGYNGTPTNFDNSCEDCNGITKKEVLHAESNAITKLAKSTQSSLGSTLYTTLSPCVDCAKLIIQSGITRVVYLEEYKCTKGIELLLKANVIISKITI